MNRARPEIPFLLSLCLLVAGCVGLGNNPVATYQKIGDRYLIEVSGRRAAWSHDLSKLEDYEDRWTFDVPRIDGNIDGKEIRQKPGFLSYVGSITIHGKRMVVSLSADDYYVHKLQSVAWNGSYTLMEKTGNAYPGKK